MEESNSDTDEGLTPLKLFRFKKGFLEDEAKIVTKVTFHTFQTRETSHTIVFPKKVSVIYAVRKVEDWLSEDVCKDYYRELMQKLKMDVKPWIEVEDIFEIRGDFLGDFKYLREPKVNSDGSLIIECLDYNEGKVIRGLSE